LLVPAAPPPVQKAFEAMQREIKAGTSQQHINADMNKTSFKDPGELPQDQARGRGCGRPMQRTDGPTHGRSSQAVSQ